MGCYDKWYAIIVCTIFPSIVVAVFNVVWLVNEIVHEKLSGQVGNTREYTGKDISSDPFIVVSIKDTYERCKKRKELY